MEERVVTPEYSISMIAQRPHRLRQTRPSPNSRRLTQILKVRRDLSAINWRKISPLASPHSTPRKWHYSHVNKKRI
jgi:hypothetical protein